MTLIIMTRICSVLKWFDCEGETCSYHALTFDLAVNSSCNQGNQKGRVSDTLNTTNISRNLIQVIPTNTFLKSNETAKAYTLNTVLVTYASVTQAYRRLELFHDIKRCVFCLRMWNVYFFSHWASVDHVVIARTIVADNELTCSSDEWVWFQL